MRMTLDDMRTRLNRPIPASYTSFLAANTDLAFHDSLASPAEICALNLNARALSGPRPTDQGFVLLCRDGDYYLIVTDDQGDHLYDWSHETAELTAVDGTPLQLLAELAACPIADDVASSGFWMCRTDYPSQAILEPITFRELQVAARGIAGAELFEAMEATNPFTQEVMRLETPGICFTDSAGDTVTLRLLEGNLLSHEEPDTVADQVALLAQALRCRIVR